jgi:hypothetical protein
MTGLFDSRSDLAKIVRGLPPEIGGRLTFHLPLELQALEVAGAGDDVIAARIEQRLPEAFASALIDPPLYRWAEKSYASEGAALLSSNVDQRRAAFAEVASLGPGLAGAAFHALIRAGYGALRQDPHEISRGLAYLRVRRQVLFSRAPVTNSRFEVSLPTPEEFGDTSVFDQLDLVAGERSLYRTDGPEPEIPAVEALCKVAFGLVERNPDSFIAIHTVTGLHALVELTALLTGREQLGGVPDDPLLVPWWRAMSNALTACVMLVEATPASEPSRPYVAYDGLEQLVDASIESCEVHDLKISVSLSRLVELGVASAKSALAVGSAKLAATECSA